MKSANGVLTTTKPLQRMSCVCMFSLIAALVFAPSIDAQTADKSKQKKPSSELTKTGKETGQRNSAPHFPPLPGPQVKLTGKFFDSMPAGFRMHAKTTNYWTNRSMTATRSTYLELTRDGQFEVSSSSISGGGAGSIVVATAGDKKETVGSVGGAGGISLHKRKGLDPSKYGTYFISGKQIEMRFANGKVVSKSFKTDGYKELVIDDKRYFVDTPKDWERRDGKLRHYRYLNGDYRASATWLKQDIPNGQKWMENYLKKIKSEKWYVSAGPIKWYKGAYKHYKVAHSSGIVKDDKGRKSRQEFFFKFGTNERVFIQVAPYTENMDLNQILEFLKYL